MNLELMKAVSAAVKAHPNHFDMGEWYRHDGGPLDDDSCGTRACLAGWTMHCAGRVSSAMRIGGVSRTATDALDLMGLEERLATDLFHRDWPISNWKTATVSQEERALAVWDTWIALERICRLTYDVDGNLVPAEQ